MPVHTARGYMQPHVYSAFCTAKKSRCHSSQVFTSHTTGPGSLSWRGLMGSPCSTNQIVADAYEHGCQRKMFPPSLPPTLLKSLYQPSHVVISGSWQRTVIVANFAAFATSLPKSYSSIPQHASRSIQQSSNFPSVCEYGLWTISFG